MKKLALVLFLGLGGCAHTPIHEINERWRDILEQRRTQYKVKAADTISMKFYNVPDVELTQTVTVLPDGRCDPFFMDDMIVAGKTVKELEADIKKFYAQSVSDAELSVQITPALEQIILEGELGSGKGVGSGGGGTGTAIPYTPNLTLLQAMGQQGGYKLTACLHNIIVRRSYLNPRYPEVFHVNIRDFANVRRDTIDMPEDLMLLPGDHIIVQRNLAILIRDLLEEYFYGFFPPLLRSFIPGSVFGV